MTTKEIPGRNEQRNFVIKTINDAIMAICPLTIRLRIPAAPPDGPLFNTQTVNLKLSLAHVDADPAGLLITISLVGDDVARLLPLPDTIRACGCVILPEKDWRVFLPYPLDTSIDFAAARGPAAINSLSLMAKDAVRKTMEREITTFLRTDEDLKDIIGADKLVVEVCG